MIDWHQSFFDCAEMIVKTRTVNASQPHLFFFASESLKLRQWAKNTYGDRIVTDTQTSGVHSAGHKEACQNESDPKICQQKFLDDAMVQASSQLYAASLADYHIISRDSGFSRLGAYTHMNAYK